VPADIGRYPVVDGRTGKKSFCWMDVHTHDSGGTLHLAVDPKNPRLFGPVLKVLADKMNRPLSSVVAIYTNGEPASPFYVEPGMHIKVVFGTPSPGARKTGK
jgi:hypothetical protein